MRAASVCSLSGLSDYAVWHAVLYSNLPAGCGSLPTCQAGTRLANGVTLGECSAGCCYSCGAYWSIVRSYEILYGEQAGDMALTRWIKAHADGDGMGFLDKTEYFPNSGSVTTNAPKASKSCGDKRDNVLAADTDMWSALHEEHDGTVFRGFGDDSGNVCGRSASAPLYAWAGSYRRLNWATGPGFKVVFVEENKEGSKQPMTGGSIWIESWASPAEQTKWDGEFAAES